MVAERPQNYAKIDLQSVMKSKEGIYPNHIIFILYHNGIDVSDS